MSIKWPMAILYRFLEVSKNMVYGHLIMKICRAYELDLKGWGVKNNIEYKLIKSEILNNAHFHGLHCADKIKLGKYTMLKEGEVRVQGPMMKIKLWKHLWQRSWPE